MKTRSPDQLSSLIVMLPASVWKVGLNADPLIVSPLRVRPVRLQVTWMSGTGSRSAPMLTALQVMRNVPSTGNEPPEGGPNLMVMLEVALSPLAESLNVAVTVEEPCVSVL